MSPADPGPWVMRLLELADGRPSPDAGHYLRAYDPHAYDGFGLIDTTPNPSEAVCFPSTRAAMDCWKRGVGTRLDGKPNRPLTAWTVEVLPLTKALAKDTGPYS